MYMELSLYTWMFPCVRINDDDDDDDDNNECLCVYEKIHSQMPLAASDWRRKHEKSQALQPPSNKRALPNLRPVNTTSVHGGITVGVFDTHEDARERREHR